MTGHTRVLLIEDDEDLSSLICLHLADYGYATTSVSHGRHGLEEVLSHAYDLVVLDVMLPDIDGFEVCREVRASGSRVPVLMLTARAEEVDRVLGLEIGADDYLTKPFSVRELQARVKALLRRADMTTPEAEFVPEVLRFAELVVVPDRRIVRLRGESVDLTAKEFDLLTLFARNPGKAFSRLDLLKEVWGYQYEGYSHTVNTHINRLRGKLGDDPSDPRFIKTVWGHGYSFIAPEEVSA